jgi:hypothetical protein
MANPKVDSRREGASFPHSLFPTPHSPLPIPYSLAEIFWNFVWPVACKCAFGEINVISLFKPLS